MIARFSRYLGLMLAIAGLWVPFGCGVDHSPTASEPGLAPWPAGKTYLSFVSAPGGQRAGKILGGNKDNAGGTRDGDGNMVDRKRTQTKTITPNGGSVKVDLKNDRGGQDNLMAMLKVPEGALNEKVEITLTLLGENLADLMIEFGPAGLEFKIPAELRIKVGKDLVNLTAESLVALHTDDSGSTKQVRIRKVEQTEDATWIIIDVPSFSTYSLGGGRR